MFPGAAAATPQRHLSLYEVRRVEEEKRASSSSSSSSSSDPIKALTSVSSYPEEALILPYYHPTLATMKEVRDLFSQNLSTNGFFLLRKSFSQFSTLAVSVAYNQVIKHFNISRKDNGAYYLQDKQFQSLHTLVDYYKTQEVPNKEGLTGLHLKYPILDGKRHRFFDNASKPSRRKHPDAPKPRPTTEPKTQRKLSSKDNLDMGDVTCRSSRRHPPSPPPPPPGRHRRVNVLPDCVNHNNGKSGEIEKESSSLHDCPRNRPRGDQSASLKVGGGASDLLEQVRRRTESETDSRGYEKLLIGAANRDGRRAADELESRAPSKKNEEFKYSYARSPYKAMAADLMDSLRRIEGDDANKCVCGVYHDDADLPRGWTFHRSTDPATYGKVVFSSPDGELSWNLPIEVALELSAEQQDVIRELICCRPPMGTDSIVCDRVFGGSSGSGSSNSSSSSISGKVAHNTDTRRSKRASSSATVINAYLEVIADE